MFLLFVGDFFVNIDFFLYDIKRSSFDLVKNSAYVNADYAKETEY